MKTGILSQQLVALSRTGAWGLEVLDLCVGVGVEGGSGGQWGGLNSCHMAEVSVSARGGA